MQQLVEHRYEMKLCLQQYTSYAQIAQPVTLMRTDYDFSEMNCHVQRVSSARARARHTPQLSVLRCSANKQRLASAHADFMLCLGQACMYFV